MEQKSLPEKQAGMPLQSLTQTLNLIIVFNKCSVLNAEHFAFSFKK
jgi:hypothetical protein